MSGALSVPSGDSLLLGSGRQITLLDVDEAGLPPAAYERLEDRGRWTGERLFLANPKLYGAIVKLLARGLTYREIAEVCEVSVNTVCGVVYREGITIETLRERIGRLGFDVAQLSLETIRDLLADPEFRKRITAKDLAIIHGIAFTNAQLALGGATSRAETLPQSPPDHEAYMAFLKNVTPIGSGPENPQPKEPGPGVIEIGTITPLPDAPPTSSTPTN